VVQKTQSGSSRLGSTVKDFANYLAKKKEFKNQVLWTLLLNKKSRAIFKKYLAAAQYCLWFKSITKSTSVIRKKYVKF
jgi:hypothetical protein